MAYPTSIEENTYFQTAYDNLATELTAELAPSDGTAYVTSTTNWPAIGWFTVGTDIRSYTGKAAGSFTGVTDSVGGTTPGTHAAGTAVSLTPNATAWNRIVAQLRAVMTALGVTGTFNFVDVTLAQTVAGIKTFSASPVINSVSITSGITDKTRTIAFTTAGAIPASTNGANQNLITGTNYMYYQLEFDKDTDESVYWTFPVPPQYDGGNVKFYVQAKCATVTSGTVLWIMDTNSNADSTTWDTALGTTITFAAKTVDGTALDVFTANKTADPAWVAGEVATLKLWRDVSGDDAAEDVDVVAVWAEWEVA